MSKIESMLIEHESMVLHAYEDTVGSVSIGVGRNLDSLGISKDEALYMLANDIKRCQDEVSGAFPWFADLSPVRQDVMVMLCFNLGLTRLRGFRRALGHMKVGSYCEAADEFLRSKWAGQVGNRAVVLTNMITQDKYP